MTDSPPATDAETPEQVRSLFRLVGSVVAPTTLLTALLFYFGWAYSAEFFEYYGLDISLMGLTTQNYITNSVQVLFVPLAVAFSAGLLIAWLHARLKARVFGGPGAPKRLRWTALASGACGLVLFGIGLVGVFRGRAGFSLRYPLCFGTGAVLLVYASRLHGRSEPTSVMGGVRSTALLEVTAAFFIVALSLFWAATNYAAEVGIVKARDFERFELPRRHEAVLYSKAPLHLEAPGVHETSCGEPAGGYRFRYDGLRLMLRSAGHYFLLPVTWSLANSVAIVVPETADVRLQFDFPAVDDRGQTAPGAITCPAP